MKRILVVALAASLAAGTLFARQRRHAESAPGAFDYYLFNLSWAPEFCSAHAGSVSSSECDPAHHLGFIVHGLWPENNDGSYPQNCGAASPVAQSTVQQMLPIVPARGLIQHEWARHGTCSGLAAEDYFKQIQRAYHQVQIPQEYRNPSVAITATPADIERKFAQSNHAPAGAFRVVCSRTEIDVEVCLTKELQYRECGRSLRDCNAEQITLPPVR